MKQKKLWRILAVLAILGSLSFSAYIWIDVVSWNRKVESMEGGWFKNPELGRLELMLRYQITFAKIILLNGLVLTLIFVLPKAIKIGKENG